MPTSGRDPIIVNQASQEPPPDVADKRSYIEPQLPVQATCTPSIQPEPEQHEQQPCTPSAPTIEPPQPSTLREMEDDQPCSEQKSPPSFKFTDTDTSGLPAPPLPPGNAPAPDTLRVVLSDEVEPRVAPHQPLHNEDLHGISLPVQLKLLHKGRWKQQKLYNAAQSSPIQTGNH